MSCSKRCESLPTISSVFTRGIKSRVQSLRFIPMQYGVYGPIVRRSFSPKVRWSEGPLVRRPVSPKVH